MIHVIKTAFSPKRGQKVDPIIGGNKHKRENIRSICIFQYVLKKNNQLNSCNAFREMLNIKLLEGYQT